MTLRFVPRFKAQLDTVKEAQASIGRDPGEGSVLQRLKKAVTVLSIMVTWSLENAIETADSMRCRGYGLPGRTAFSIYRLDSRDKLALGWLLLCGLYLCGGWAAGQFAWRYYPTIKGAVGLLPFSFQAVYLALSFTPVFLDLREDAKWKRLASEI